ncbi:MAG: oxygen-independent coproporphyrinogen III oxidase-like protein, partial [Gammaproteobacteria bacterium]|nr:oxygen-independent coproporphyrinogen III oxidase-like protein [Gammaproteobacteria bacterium]
VEQALALGVTHLSHYQLTLEPGTAFFSRPPQLPNDDERFDIEAACAERIAGSGLKRYEISAWATPDQECRHNLNYWEFGDYLALGAGAHGKISQPDGPIQRYRRVRLPRLYQSLAGTPEAIAESHEVSANQRPLEYLMNALRLTRGTSLNAALARTGLTEDAFEPGLSIARSNGWLDPQPDWLRATPLGSRFLDDLLGLFVVEQSA